MRASVIRKIPDTYQLRYDRSLSHFETRNLFEDITSMIIDSDCVYI